MKPEKFWNILERVAIANEPVSRSRVAALLVHRNELIAVGYNKMKSHPMAKRFQKHEEALYLHAEVDCIKNALRVVDVDYLPKCTMYVLRVKHPDNSNKKFVRGLAKPCSGCNMAIDTFGIKKVYFTTNEGYDTL